MANIFNNILTNSLLLAKANYRADEKAIYGAVADGIYIVKIENITARESKNSVNPLIEIDSTEINSGMLINSKFVFSNESAIVSLQSLRNLLIYCNVNDFTEDELKDSEKMVEKLSEVIGHYVQIELKTSKSGFQSTSFISSINENINDNVCIAEEDDYDE